MVLSPRPHPTSRTAPWKRPARSASITTGWAAPMSQGMAGRSTPSSICPPWYRASKSTSLRSKSSGRRLIGCSFCVGTSNCVRSDEVAHGLPGEHRAPEQPPPRIDPADQFVHGPPDQATGGEHFQRGRRPHGGLEKPAKGRGNQKHAQGLIGKLGDRDPAVRPVAEQPLQQGSRPPPHTVTRATLPVK